MNLLSIKGNMLTGPDEIEKWLVQYNIENYRLQKNSQHGFIVNTQGDVNLKGQNLARIPIKFGRIEGHFDCSENKLKDFDFAPYYVAHGFYASQNELTSLKGCPNFVGADMNVSENKIKNLDFFPKFLGREFNISKNELKTLEGLPKVMNGGLFCRANRLQSLKGAPEHIKGSLNCADNEITSLEHCPPIIEFNLFIYNNPIEHFRFIPSEVRGDIHLFRNSEKENKTMKAELVRLGVVLENQSLKYITINYDDLVGLHRATMIEIEKNLIANSIEMRHKNDNANSRGNIKI